MTKIFAIQGPSFDLRLSRWDMRFTAMYSKRLMCFPLRNNDPENLESVTSLLLKALQATVEEVPFLAGSVVPLSKEQPWLRDIQPEGAAYLEVNDLSQELNFAELRKACFASSLLDIDKLCPFPAAAYFQSDPLDVCRFRANFIDGGIILVAQIIHTVFDGRGISDVIRIFANNLEDAQKDSVASSLALHPQDVPKHSYTFDRSLILSGDGTHGNIENHPCWTVAPFIPRGGVGSTRTICTNFYISADSLLALKQAVSPSSAPISFHQHSNPSTHDAIAALIWRSLMLARQRAGILSSELAHFATAVDCRRHLNLPKPYFGNAIYGIKLSLSLTDLVSSTGFESISDPTSPIPGLQCAAQMIRSKINDTTAATFRDLLGFVERTDTKMLTRLSVIEDLGENTMMLISYFGFEMYDLNFGEALGGHMEAYRLPAGGVVPGMPVVLPKLPDGSCEFVMHEREDVMGFLEEDMVFGKFVRKQF